MSPNQKKSPLLILALDAGDIEFMTQWMSDGSLPTMEGIRRRGCHGTLSSSNMAGTDFGLWMTVFSGMPMHNHGYYYFRQLHPGSYDLRLRSHLDYAVAPFWSYSRGASRKVAIIDPPEFRTVPGLDGIQLADWAARKVPQITTIKPAADPPGLIREARRVTGTISPIDDLPRGNLADDLRVYRRWLDQIERKGALLRKFLSKDRYDLFVIGFYEAHYAAHRFWEYRRETALENGGRGGTGLEDAIRNVYQAIDHEIGRLLAMLPDDTTVVILSCYGMLQMYPISGLTEAFCHDFGYQTKYAHTGQSSSALTAKRPTDIMRRLIPQSWRTGLSHRLPPSVQERLLADHFRTITDWSKTTAFSIPSVYSSFLRVNLCGREPQGCVAQGEEYDSLLSRIEEQLRQLIDPHTGKPAVARVGRSMGRHDGKVPRVLPDLFVTWHGGKHFISRLVHPRGELTQDKPGFFRGSSHSDKGIFIAAGPLITPRGEIGPLAALDMAPTFLDMLGLSVPPDLIGKPVPVLAAGHP